MHHDYIVRHHYLNRLIPFIDKNIVKILMGQRRVGKSYMLFQLMDHIKQKNKKSRIIYINKEMHEFRAIGTDEDLLHYVEKRRDQNGITYLVIDEIQEIALFEKAIRSLSAEGGYDIYCTGSNANLLSADIATFLAGRYMEFKIYGLSYPEFARFHNLKKDKDTLLKYIKYGGLPYLRNLVLEDHIVYDYLKDIYRAILFKDIVVRHNIRNIAFLERLVEYLADNTGNSVSAKKISDFLKSQKINISPNVILNYLSYLCAAFFIFKTRRSEIHRKKIFEIGEKYYFEDLGLRHAISGYHQGDIGKIIENVVYLHLIISGYEVTTGKLGDKEIDFVCTRGSEKCYVQATYLIPDKKVHQREFGNLLKIRDNYPKIVVSMDEMIGGTYEGVQHLHLSAFLSVMR